MRIFNTILRLISLIIAGIGIIAIYSRDNPFSSKGSVPPIGATGPLVMVFPLIFIWFGDSLAQFEEDRGSWCPALLLKLLGWVFLVVLVVALVLI